MALPFVSIPRIYRVDDVLPAEDLEAWCRLTEDIVSWVTVEHDGHGKHNKPNVFVAAGIMLAQAGVFPPAFIPGEIDGFTSFEPRYFAQLGGFHYIEFELPENVLRWSGVAVCRWAGTAIADAVALQVQQVSEFEGRVDLGTHSEASNMISVLVVIFGEVGA